MHLHFFLHFYIKLEIRLKLYDWSPKITAKNKSGRVPLCGYSILRRVKNTEQIDAKIRNRDFNTILRKYIKDLV